MSRANFADLLRAQRDKEQKQQNEKPKLEIVQPTPPTSLTSTAPPAPSVPVAPEKDFAKVANSIVREALPSGMFIGKSKQIYDYLYSLTRGAVKPVRTIRITKSKLMRGSCIGSERTLLKNLTHLKNVGLVKITAFEGQHFGNEYTIFLPEEVFSNPSDPPHIPTPPHPRHPLQKVGGVPPAESGVGGVGLLADNKALSETLRLSFKDIENNDDEPCRAMGKVLGEMGKGKASDWSELAELLKMEFEVAAARTKSVSNVPAFLTEHLRRRLAPAKRKKPQNRITESRQFEKRQSSEMVETYEAEPLTEQGRESTLKAFIGYMKKGQEEFLMGLEESYIPEDWQWLMDNLKINNLPVKTDAG